MIDRPARSIGTGRRRVESNIAPVSDIAAAPQAREPQRYPHDDEAKARGVDAAEITGWAREHMAAYKVPHIVEFVDALPRSGSGKVMWRVLQEREG